MRRRAVLLAVALAAALLPAPAAVAKTGVSVDGTVVTFHVPIDVEGMETYRFRDPETGEFTVDADDAARLFEDDANALWNDQLADLPFLDCFTFRIDIDLNPVPRGHARTGGRHRIGYRSEPTFRSYVNFPPSAGPTGDSSTLYQGSVDGEWFMAHLPHEAGHLLGLDDDYIDVGGVYRDTKSIPKPGREGTIMDGGDAVDQNLVDRLGELLGDVEDLPECWTGTIQSETTRTYMNPENAGQACTDVWEGELAFTVDETGAVKGEGEAALTSGPACDFPVGQGYAVAKKAFFTVEGDAGDAGFTLRLGVIRWVPETGPSMAGFHEILITGSGTVDAKPPGPAFEIPKLDSCGAEGDFTTKGTVPPYNDPTSVKSMMELQCSGLQAG